MGTNYGVGHIGGGGGEIIGPDDRAWGFRGVAITAHRSLASGEGPGSRAGIDPPGSHHGDGGSGCAAPA